MPLDADCANTPPTDSMQAFVLTLALAAPSPTSTSGVELGWDVPAGCPDRRYVHEQIGIIVGRESPPEGHAIGADVRIQRIDDRFELRLGLSTGGTRTLRGDDCRELADAAALIIAIAVDPRVLERVEAPQEQPEPEQPAASAGTVPEPQRPARLREAQQSATTPPPSPDPEPRGERRPAPEPSPPEPRPQQSAHLGVMITGGPSIELLPRITGTLGTHLIVSGPWWRTTAGARFWLPTTRDSPANPQVGARLWAWAVAVRGCAVPHAGPVEFPLCAGLDGGAIHGRGTGALEARQATAPWLHALAHAGLLWWVVPDRLGLLIRGGPLLPLVRASFATEPSGLVYRAPAVAGEVLAGIEVRLR